ncbi:glyoxalase/bleomycin resistance/dioxygenase family protein [Bacteriovorax stolpii]|uniref:ArsI/CadI family heavy metal resistance metalloenzyme n=1 Tax=Bacteriovorax stolpii TaxID=960 RepID=UPI001159F60B|nr:ArsI/CadI family heavy metal resistance metalloenzyme [Bacteriovorax stolpii]QDK42377.1 glyoxalase/bleomycin resistance/dioxygenase family protein [Bacteriovorax stolpii]
MKRFHVHVGVKDLNESIQFYSTLFGQKPSKQKEDYAKWMLEDPRMNFAISTRVGEEGVDHLGFQVDESSELGELTERLKKADLGVYGEETTTCCYANSEKAWVKDPSGVAWEAYHTMSDAEVFNEKIKEVSSNACCAPTKEATTKGCC